MNNETRHIGAAIRSLRKAQDRTLEELAEKIDSDASNLSRMERGEQEITTEKLSRISHALNVPISGIYRLAETGSQDPDDTAEILSLVTSMGPDTKRQILDYARFMSGRHSE